MFVTTLIILALGVGGIYYFRFQKREPVAPSPIPEVPLATSSVPSDWGIYQSPNFGYSIAYPPEFELREQGKVSEEVLDVTSFVTSFEGKRAPVFQVKVSSLSYQEEIEKRKIKIGGFAPEGVIAEEITIFGVKAVRTAGKTVDGKPTVSVFIPVGNKTFVLLGGPEAVPGQDYTETINQMVSTFNPH